MCTLMFRSRRILQRLIIGLHIDCMDWFILLILWPHLALLRVKLCNRPTYQMHCQPIGECISCIWAASMRRINSYTFLRRSFTSSRVSWLQTRNVTEIHRLDSMRLCYVNIMQETVYYEKCCTQTFDAVDRFIENAASDQISRIGDMYLHRTRIYIINCRRL